MMPPASKTRDGFELQFGTNHLGHFALTGLLLQALLNTPGSRVVNVSSMAHKAGQIDFSDLNWEHRKYQKWASYGQSKLANLLFTYELQRRLEAAGADSQVLASHPGWTGTDLQRHSGLIRALNPLFSMKPWQGALPTLFALILTAGTVLADRVIEFMREAGIPNGLSAVGFTSDDIPALVEGTMPQQRITKLAARANDEKDIARMFEDAMTYW